MAEKQHGWRIKPVAALEPQYTESELAKLWKMTSTTIIRMFRDEASVLKYTSQTGLRRYRSYVTLRIRSPW